MSGKPLTVYHAMLFVHHPPREHKYQVEFVDADTIQLAALSLCVHRSYGLVWTTHEEHTNADILSPLSLNLTPLHLHTVIIRMKSQVNRYIKLFGADKPRKTLMMRTT